jgi:magnesium transporter
MLSRREHKQLVWLDLHKPTPDEIRATTRKWGIHPLVGDELLSPSPRQKTERYGDYLFLVLHFPFFGREHARKGHEHLEKELDIVVGRHLVVTVTFDEMPALTSFGQDFSSAIVLEQGPLGSQSGHLLFLMISKLYRSLNTEIEYVRDELRRIEERIFSGEEKYMVTEISHISRVLLDFRRSLTPHRQILSSLEAAGSRVFGQEFSFYVRLLEGEYLKVQEALDEMRDSLQELRETNNSLLSTKQNETIKELTIVASVFLPVSFIASLFAMRTDATPLVGMPHDFWLVVGVMLIVGLLFILYFKGKKWL